MLSEYPFIDALPPLLRLLKYFLKTEVLLHSKKEDKNEGKVNENLEQYLCFLVVEHS